MTRISRVKTKRNVRDTVKLFYSLGFTAPPEKSSFLPQHRITFMGFIIDSITMTVYPTSEKVEKIIHTGQGWIIFCMLFEKPSGHYFAGGQMFREMVNNAILESRDISSHSDSSVNELW